MIAFISSSVILFLLLGAIFSFGKRRPKGTPLTWGEAIVAALVVFSVLFLAYGVVPHQWLSWADGPLKWRNDAVGIPAGPFGGLLRRLFGAKGHYFSAEKNVLWPNGITFFGRGKIIVAKQVLRDIIAANIYIVLLGVQIFVWSAWQKRGQAAAKKAVLEPTSSFGRPLVRKA